MPKLTQERYHELLAFRNEGLRKVGTRYTDDIERPQARCFFPTVWHGSRETSYPAVSLGPIRVSPVGPTLILADEAIAERSRAKVLDVGCGAGRFRDYLQLRRPKREIEYVGMDVAPPAVDFPVYRDLGDVTDRDFDLILMSEVAEHMPADVFADDYLRRFPAMLKPNGVLVVSVPNPLAPTILHRDVTHVQHYPWFDLYAMLRFFFDDVDVVRTHFVCSFRRLFSLPMRRVLSFFLEVDWCEGIVLLARQPRLEKMP